MPGCDLCVTQFLLYDIIDYGLENLRAQLPEWQLAHLVVAIRDLIAQKSRPVLRLRPGSLPPAPCQGRHIHLSTIPTIRHPHRRTDPRP